MNKENLRIVFMGTPEFAVTSLQTLVERGYNVVAAVTQPDKLRPSCCADGFSREEICFGTGHSRAPTREDERSCFLGRTGRI